MPVLSDEELDRIAKEGDALNRVNTILGRNPMPGVGMPGSTPQTDAGNISMANSMERSDRGNRFGFNSPQYLQNSDTPEVAAPESPGLDMSVINERRNMLLKGVDPDRPALYVTPQRRAELNRELGVLTDISREHSLTSAKTAHQALLKQRDIDASSQSVKILDGLRNHKYPLGTPEHEQEVIDLLSGNPYGVGTDAVQKVLPLHVKMSDRAALLRQARSPVDKTPPPDMKLATVSRDDSGKEHVSFRPADESDKDLASIEKELVKLHKITPNELLNPVSVKRGKITDAKGKPGNFTNNYKEAAEGPAVQIDTGSRVVTMSNSEYARYKEALSPKSMPNAAIETPADIDKKALAQKALADPNASEAHKAAARKILGQ